MKIKKILITFTCLALCLLVPSANVLAVGGEEILIAVLEEAVKYTITQIADDDTSDDAIKNYYIDNHKSAVEGVVYPSLKKAEGTNEIKINNYIFLTGKYTFKYRDAYGDDCEFMVSCSMYYNDGYSTNYSHSAEIPDYITGADGLLYLPNNIYWSIYRSDGTFNRYRWASGSDLTKSQTFSLGQNGKYYGIVSGGNVVIHRDSTGLYFDVSDGDLIGSNVTDDFGSTTRDVTFYFNSNNSILRNGNGSSFVEDLYINNTFRYHSIDSYSTPPSYVKFPLDRQICNGRIYYTESGRSSSQSFTGPYFAMANFDTNDYGEDYVRQYNTSASQKLTYNYYYDNSFKGGTIINNDNKTTVLDGTLSNAFDIDGKVVALADVSAAIKPLLDVSLDHLADLITDFYTNMPDFGLPWSGGGDNNYLELPNPLPEPYGGGGGGGSGGDITVIVTVDVSRPLVPAVTTEQWLELEVPTMTTATYPVDVVSAAPTLFSKSDDVINQMELMPIYGLLALFGVAVAILFKGV